MWKYDVIYKTGSTYVDCWNVHRKTEPRQQVTCTKNLRFWTCAYRGMRADRQTDMLEWIKRSATEAGPSRSSVQCFSSIRAQVEVWDVQGGHTMVLPLPSIHPPALGLQNLGLSWSICQQHWLELETGYQCTELWNRNFHSKCWTSL